MTTKKLRKQKRKRGHSVQEIEFLTPLSVRECMEHLESGRSPFKHWAVKPQEFSDQFAVYLVNNYSALRLGDMNGISISCGLRGIGLSDLMV